MKKVILFVFLTAVGCKTDKVDAEKQNLNGTLSLKEEFSLKIKQQTQVDAFKLSFNSVADSRCPANALCIRAGEVVVDLAVNDTQKVQMCLGDCQQVRPSQYKGSISQDTLEVSIQNKPYLFILKQVSPYPILPVDADAQKNYEVKMEIVKK
ncbi:hypothetical protein [Runella sp.]|uniref:hypothetical protein n=1 Tax=Runella sp. TaxID=1960881 RepID=UPI003D0C237F